MAGQQQQQGGGGDNSFSPIWIMVLLFFTVYFIWKEAHQYIVSVVFFLNIIEAKAVNFFVDSQLLAREIYIMQTVDPVSVDWEQLLVLTKSVGDYIRYPVILLLVISAFWLYKSNVTLKFRRTHNMKSLRAQEMHNWPAIIPVNNLDLVKDDVNQGRWAMAMTPMEFARNYDLLRREDSLLDKPVPGQEMTAGLRRGDAKRVFTLQLGPYWDGFELCPPHVIGLAGVFIARINRDRNSAKQIMDALDKSSVTGKLDCTIANNIIRKYQNTEIIQEILQKHAYLLNIMASLLKAARDDGVVASSEFLWLKPVDRRLWYMLNCVGRQTPFAEVAGPYAQWKAELAMGRPSLVPMIDEAIKALEVAIKEIKLTPKQMQELKP